MLLEVGCLVRIHSLQSKPELDGKQGTVIVQLKEKGRWRVQVAGDNDRGSEVAAWNLKPSCLTVVAAAPEHTCPICMDNKDDATVVSVDGTNNNPGMCYTCGQLTCGACNRMISDLRKCPVCRATLHAPANEQFTKLWALVHDRTAGRHTQYARYMIGDAYYVGRGVRQNKGEAAAWFRKVEGQGLVEAPNKLGHMYELGEGVIADMVEAAKFFKIAALQGDADSQASLGRLYANGRGVGRDYVVAAKWYRLAAAQTHPVAQCNLGIMYGAAQGVQPDVRESIRLIQLAAEQGYDDALQKIEHVHKMFATAPAHVIPTPLPGTAVTTILLTSAAGSKYNNRQGKVAKPIVGAGTKPLKPGRVEVLLDGEATPISLKIVNLRV